MNENEKMDIFIGYRTIATGREQQDIMCIEAISTNKLAITIDNNNYSIIKLKCYPSEIGYESFIATEIKDILDIEVYFNSSFLE